MEEEVMTPTSELAGDGGGSEDFNPRLKSSLSPPSPASS
jgi:hypothetical protein